MLDILSPDINWVYTGYKKYPADTFWIYMLRIYNRIHTGYKNYPPDTFWIYKPGYIFGHILDIKNTHQIHFGYIYPDTYSDTYWILNIPTGYILDRYAQDTYSDTYWI